MTMFNPVSLADAAFLSQNSRGDLMKMAGSGGWALGGFLGTKAIRTGVAQLLAMVGLEDALANKWLNLLVGGYAGIAGTRYLGGMLLSDDNRQAAELGAWLELANGLFGATVKPMLPDAVQEAISADYMMPVGAYAESDFGGDANESFPAIGAEYPTSIGEGGVEPDFDDMGSQYGEQIVGGWNPYEMSY